MSRNARRILVLAGIVLVAVLLRLTVFRPAPVPVTVHRVGKGRVEETVVNSRAGTVKAGRRATLSSELGGRVAALPAKKGKRVRAGDVLLKVVDADYRAQLAVQESALVSAKAAERQACQSAAQAARELARNENLAKDQIVSVDVLDQLRTARDTSAASCDAARAGVGQAAAAVDAARVTLEKTVLKAPFDGVIADVTTEVGEWITPSPPGLPIPPVIEILDTSGIYVSAPLDEVDVARVKDGLPVRITFDAYPGRSFAGKVTRVAPFVLDVKEQNRTFDVEAALDDSSFAATLKPGLSADVTVVLRTVENVLRIPGYALLEEDHVLVLRGGRLMRVPVKTGLKNWDFVEITGGLSEGDLVVVSLDRAEVKEGARAVVAGTPGPAK
ncbi:MAG TPA: efflux RND transporter periplasmic adaptor subunit [Thermoanaerobaculia bacterium]|nr:efflux RND transporter periplasmic adaptor subunit [Thermoanaerobaculia bacterium]